MIRTGHLALAALSLLIGLASGCSLMSITRSPARDTAPQSVQLSEQVRLTATGAVDVYVFALVDHQDLVPSSFKIESPGTIIYIDPVLVDDPSPADLIFITHAHDDHFSLADVDALSGPQTMIVCPAGVAAKLGGRAHRVAAPGGDAELHGVRYEALPAYNTRGMLPGLSAHPRDAANVGYVLTVEGLRIYHAGDTDRVPELAELQDIDVALIPIAGEDLTMSTRDAAALVNTMRPRLAVPMHYPLQSDEVATFRALVDPEIDIAVLTRAKR